jgi:hypothetical protein
MWLGLDTNHHPVTNLFYEFDFVQFLIPAEVIATCCHGHLLEIIDKILKEVPAAMPKRFARTMKYVTLSKVVEPNKKMRPKSRKRP